MRKYRENNKRFPNSSTYVGIAIIGITIMVAIHVSQKSLTFKEIPYNTIIEDDKFYESSSIDGWHKITLSQFDIEVPSIYYYFKMHGIDSYVGGITNREDTIEFDYGWYSNALSHYEDKEEYIVSHELINGKKFKIVKQKNEPGFMGAYTNDLEENNALMIICKNCRLLDEKEKIFKTIKFK
jgi:hypothetical protein